MSGDSRPAVNLAGLLDLLRHDLPTLPMRVQGPATANVGPMLVHRNAKNRWVVIDLRSETLLAEYRDAQDAIVHAAQQAIVEQLHRRHSRPEPAAA